jgi:large subunit ribosomal protein L4
MEGSAATKTRGMVEGSTRKIYRQKGTGRARHGGIRAPIFVGGGIALGPRPRDIHKTITKQMKRKALASALSLVVEKNAMKVVDGLSELPVKTKSFAEMLTKIQVSKRILFVYGKDTSVVARAVRNIKNVSPFPFDSLNVYDVMNHAYVVFTKDALVSFIAKGKKV